MSKPLTKAHLDSAVKEIIEYFNKSQGLQNKHLDNIDERLDKMEEQLETIAGDIAKIKLVALNVLANERFIRNLVRELQNQGIKLNKSKIFAT